MFASAISLAEKSGSSGGVSEGDVMKASGSGHFLSDTDSDAEGEAARRRGEEGQVVEVEKDEQEGTRSRRATRRAGRRRKVQVVKKANKAEDGSESASKSKKKKKATRDWDERRRLNANEDKRRGENDDIITPSSTVPRTRIVRAGSRIRTVRPDPPPSSPSVIGVGSLPPGNFVVGDGFE